MTVDTIEDLEALYTLAPSPASLVKEVDRITPHYRRLIAVSPFVALATNGPEGLDCSPRGDRPGCVRVADERTLVIPDRRGNNRIDTLRNIIHDPRVALLFLIPGSGTTFRVNGRAMISAEPELLASFAVDGHVPRTAVVVTVEAAYFQCARAIVRADLWNPDRHVGPRELPTPGEILAALSADTVGGASYDEQWSARAAATLW